MWFKIVTLVLVLVVIIAGLRSIRRNFNDFITKDDEQKLKRDRQDRDKGGVVDLKRDPKDGIFRPKDDDDKNA